MRRKRLVRLFILTAIALAVYRFRWGVLGLIGLGPPPRACEDIAVLNTYLRTGGNPSAYLGRTPLIVCAAESGSYEVVSKLIELDVDIDAQRVPLPPLLLLPIMSQDIGTTALYETVDEGHLELAKLLLANGADINLSRATRSPLELAVLRNKTEFLKLFLKSENVTYEIDKNLILTIGGDGYLEILELLVDADVYPEEGYGLALIGAANSGHIEVVEFLSEKAIEIDENSVLLYQRALFDAVQNNHLDITEYLINLGINVNLTDTEGNTLLHQAASLNHPEIAKALIRAGADAKRKNEQGRTPLEVATLRRSLDVENVLRH